MNDFLKLLTFGLERQKKKKNLTTLNELSLDQKLTKYS